MCLKRDRLLLSERHFNAQLAARWENAFYCMGQDALQQHVNKQFDLRTKKSIRLLAQWSSLKSDTDPTPTFDATFKQPKIVCIRENMALLFLVIRKGSLYIDNTTGKEKKTIHDIQAVFVVGLVHYNADVEEAGIDRSGTQGERLSFGMVRLTTQYNGQTTTDRPLTLNWDGEEISDTSLRASLKEHLPKYLVDLALSKNSVLFDIPEFIFQPDSSDKIGYSISTHRITRYYPLEEQELDIACMNQWFETEPWDQANTIFRKIGRFGITFGAPQVDPLFGNVVILTIVMTSITVLDGIEEKTIKDCEVSFVVDLDIDQSDGVSFEHIPQPSTSYFPPSEFDRYYPEIFNSITPRVVIDLLKEAGKTVLPPYYNPTPQIPDVERWVGISGTFIISFLASMFLDRPSKHNVPGAPDQTFTIVADPIYEFATIANSDRSLIQLTLMLKTFSLYERGVPSMVLENVKVTVEVSLVVRGHRDLSDHEHRSYELKLGARAWQRLSDTQTDHWHYVVLHYDEVHAMKSCKVEPESPTVLRNDKDREALLRSCVLIYLKAKLGGDRNILHAVPHVPKEPSPYGYFPSRVHVARIQGFHFMVVVLGIRRSPYVKDTARVSEMADEMVETPPGNHPGHDIAGLTCLPNKTLLKPLWAYINASTTVIPSAINVKRQGPGEVNFTTWEDSHGMDLQITEFKQFDWEYEGILTLNERLKIAKWLGLLNQWDKNDISLTVHTKNQFIVTPAEDYTRLKVDCQGTSTADFRIKGSKPLDGSLVQWLVSLSIGQEELEGEGVQQLKIRQNSSDRRIKPYGQSGPRLHSFNFDISGAHGKFAENFTRLSFDTLNRELNVIVDQACKAAGAEEDHRRTYSFNRQGDLVIRFGRRRILLQDHM